MATWLYPHTFIPSCPPHSHLFLSSTAGSRPHGGQFSPERPTIPAQNLSNLIVGSQGSEPRHVKACLAWEHLTYKTHCRMWYCLPWSRLHIRPIWIILVNTNLNNSTLNAMVRVPSNPGRRDILSLMEPCSSPPFLSLPFGSRRPGMDVICPFELHPIGCSYWVWLPFVAGCGAPWDTGV